MHAQPHATRTSAYSAVLLLRLPLLRTGWYGDARDGHTVRHASRCFTEPIKPPLILLPLLPFHHFPPCTHTRLLFRLPIISDMDGPGPCLRKYSLPLAARHPTHCCFTPADSAISLGWHFARRPHVGAHAYLAASVPLLYSADSLLSAGGFPTPVPASLYLRPCLLPADVQDRRSRRQIWLDKRRTLPAARATYLPHTHLPPIPHTNTQPSTHLLHHLHTHTREHAAHFATHLGHSTPAHTLPAFYNAYPYWPDACLISSPPHPTTGLPTSYRYPHPCRTFTTHTPPPPPATPVTPPAFRPCPARTAHPRAWFTLPAFSWATRNTARLPLPRTGRTTDI